MTKADLVDQVATAVQLPKHQTEAVITRFLEAIMAALQTEQRVDLRGFGSFRLRQRQARTGRNPRTGDTLQSLPNRSPRLPQGKPSKSRYTLRQHGLTVPTMGRSIGRPPCGKAGARPFPSKAS